MCDQGKGIGSRNRMLRKKFKGLHSIKNTISRGIKSSLPRTFPCHLEACGKVFTDKASLKKHLTVHGDKLVS